MAEETKKALHAQGVSVEGSEKKDYERNSIRKDNQNITENQVFARVADKYFQKVTTPDGNSVWMARDKQELKADGVVLGHIPKYYGFTVEHNFTDYRPEINGWLNLSTALRWQPIEGNFPTITKLFKHIFGEQLDIGYDRYSLLVRNPHQLQPILVVTSREQGTGKTTLLFFDSLLFGCNAVILNVSQYSQQFNCLFASKLTIGIDETVISESFIKERLKQDSTAKNIQLRKMHTEHQTLPFYGKFTLCTNRETDFATLEEEDMRFWVRKVGRIEDFDPDFETKIAEEMPHFLHFLLHRDLATPKPLSRQWFSREQLYTDALENVLTNSRTDCAKDIQLFVEEKLAEIKGFGITASELRRELGYKHSINDVSKAIREELKIEVKNSSYTDMYGTTRKGRYYQFGEKMEGIGLPY